MALSGEAKKFYDWAFQEISQIDKIGLSENFSEERLNQFREFLKSASDAEIKEIFLFDGNVDSHHDVPKAALLNTESSDLEATAKAIQKAYEKIPEASFQNVLNDKFLLPSYMSETPPDLIISETLAAWKNIYTDNGLEVKTFLTAHNHYAFSLNISTVPLDQRESSLTAWKEVYKAENLDFKDALNERGTYNFLEDIGRATPAQISPLLSTWGDAYKDLDFKVALASSNHGAFRDNIRKATSDQLAPSFAAWKAVYKDKSLNLKDALAFYNHITFRDNVRKATPDQLAPSFAAWKEAYKAEGLEFKDALAAENHKAFINNIGKATPDQLAPSFAAWKEVYKAEGLEFKDALASSNHRAFRDNVRQATPEQIGPLLSSWKKVYEAEGLEFKVALASSNHGAFRNNIGKATPEQIVPSFAAWKEAYKAENLEFVVALASSNHRAFRDNVRQATPEQIGPLLSTWKERYEAEALWFKVALDSSNHGAFRDNIRQATPEQIGPLLSTWKERYEAEGLEFKDALTANNHAAATGIYYRGSSDDIALWHASWKKIYKAEGLEFKDALSADNHDVFSDHIYATEYEQAKASLPAWKKIYEAEGLEFKDALTANNHNAFKEHIEVSNNKVNIAYLWQEIYSVEGLTLPQEVLNEHNITLLQTPAPGTIPEIVTNFPYVPPPSLSKTELILSLQEFLDNPQAADDAKRNILLHNVNKSKIGNGQYTKEHFDSNLSKEEKTNLETFVSKLIEEVATTPLKGQTLVDAIDDFINFPLEFEEYERRQLLLSINQPGLGNGLFGPDSFDDDLTLGEKSALQAIAASIKPAIPNPTEQAPKPDTSNNATASNTTASPEEPEAENEKTPAQQPPKTSDHPRHTNTGNVMLGSGSEVLPDSALIGEAQSYLYALGFLKEPLADCKEGPLTRAALEAYLKDKNIDPDNAKLGVVITALRMELEIDEKKYDPEIHQRLEKIMDNPDVIPSSQARIVQHVMNAMGFTDASNKKLVVDAKIGSKTQAAYKKYDSAFDAKAENKTNVAPPKAKNPDSDGPKPKSQANVEPPKPKRPSHVNPKKDFDNSTKTTPATPKPTPAIVQNDYSGTKIKPGNPLYDEAIEAMKQAKADSVDISKPFLMITGTSIMDTGKGTVIVGHVDAEGNIQVFKPDPDTNITNLPLSPALSHAVNRRADWLVNDEYHELGQAVDIELFGVKMNVTPKEGADLFSSHVADINAINSSPIGMQRRTAHPAPLAILEREVGQ